MIQELRMAGVEIEYTGGANAEYWQKRVKEHGKDIGLIVGVGMEHRKWEGKPVDFWLTRDGSVTPPGMELQTRPFFILDDEYTLRFRKFMLNLVKDGAVVDKSCGLHVHISAKDSTNTFVANLYQQYTKWQPILLRLVDPTRRSNSYSRPLEATNKTDIHYILQDIRKRKSFKCVELTYLRDRYNMLNFTPIPGGRHYEVRLCHGILNPRRILNWVCLNLHIAQLVGKASNEGINFEAESPVRASEEGVKLMLKEVGWEDATDYFIDEFYRFSEKDKENKPKEMSNAYGF